METRAPGIMNDQAIRASMTLFKSRQATVEQLPFVIELLACCAKPVETSCVMLCRYRGLSQASAGEVLKLTDNQVRDIMESIFVRRSMAKQALRRELALKRGDESAKQLETKGQEMTLAELKRLPDDYGWPKTGTAGETLQGSNGGGSEEVAE